MSNYKTGKREAIADDRVPKFAAHFPETSDLMTVPIPDQVNWYAEVPEWMMLMNDTIGDCVIAAIMHVLMAVSSYVDKHLIPTDNDAETTYSAITGYDPADSSTDQGTYMLGQNGAIQYWTTKGITIGGVTNKLDACLVLSKTNVSQWKRALMVFGNMLVGIQLPTGIVPEDGEPPMLWDDPSGPVEGGHEILILGYMTLSNGVVLYVIISWGRIYHATENFLLAVIDEAVTIYDEASLSVTNVNGAGVPKQQLIEAMDELKRAA
jgi:hypothetical protein